jgi:hypothetical protein
LNPFLFRGKYLAGFRNPARYSAFFFDFQRGVNTFITKFSQKVFAPFLFRGKYLTGFQNPVRYSAPEKKRALKNETRRGAPIMTRT